MIDMQAIGNNNEIILLSNNNLIFRSMPKVIKNLNLNSKSRKIGVIKLRSKLALACDTNRLYNVPENSIRTVRSLIFLYKLPKLTDYSAYFALGEGVRLGQVRLGQVRLGQVRKFSGVTPRHSMDSSSQLSYIAMLKGVTFVRSQCEQS